MDQWVGNLWEDKCSRFEMMLDANHNSGWESFFCNRHMMIYYSEDDTDIKTELGAKQQ